MVNKLLLILLLSLTTLWGTEIESLLLKADKIVDRNPSTAYNIYQDAYEKSKKTGAKHGIYHSLYGLIKSGKALRKNVRAYQNSFSMLNLPTLTNYRVGDEKLVLEFDRKVANDNYRTFELSKNRFVIDIYSDFPSKTIRINDKFVKNVTIANYKTALSRVVLQSKTTRKYKISTWKNKLIIEHENKTPAANIIQEETTEEKVYQNVTKFKQRVVVLDAGHGGKDSGAVGYGYKEKHVVLNITRKLARELKRRGYKVYMTRSRDVYIKLKKRTDYANDRKADLFLSIHANASPVRKSAKGLEVYFLSPARTERAKRAAAKENAFEMNDMNARSQEMFLNFLNREKIIASNKLAIDLQKGMLDSLKASYSGINDSGVREGPFWVLVGAQMPAALAEVGYMSNKNECQRLQNHHYQTLVAKGLADGIDRFFINNSR